MIFGYNTDVKSGDVVYHVQTEDRGEKNPVIDSVIYVKGRIVDRRRTRYQPGATPPERLQEMVKAQHRELVDAIRGGTYVIPEEGAGPAATPVPGPAPAAVAAAKAEPPPPLPSLELLNSASIEQNGYLVFQLLVRDRSSGRHLPGVMVRALFQDDQERGTRSQAAASPEGTAEIRFQIPAGEGATVLFEAAAGEASSMVKFRLTHRED